MKGKYSWIALLLLFVAVTGVSVTLAWLMAKSHPVTNVFTAGDIEITLTESTGVSYQMLPGVAITKDPLVTVKSGSEACWLFIKTEKTDGFDSYIDYEINGDWTALGEDGVYYRQVGTTVKDETFEVLTDNAVTVKDTVTEEILAELSKNPTLKFRAYAIQMEGNDTAQEAWDNILAKE